ncbi:hypothetical protein GCM10009788_04430 [Nocardioides humi]|uniref:Uncharacterized protein n=1 Tax=Nocardioides humi TaxID=449461 RepID=A0ABN1ZTJ7_9ACTN
MALWAIVFLKLVIAWLEYAVTLLLLAPRVKCLDRCPVPGLPNHGRVRLRSLTADGSGSLGRNA